MQRRVRDVDAEGCAGARKIGKERDAIALDGSAATRGFAEGGLFVLFSDREIQIPC